MLKKIIGTVGTVLFFAMLFLILNDFQDSVGQDEIANQTIENGKESLGNVWKGVLIAGAVGSIVSVIALGFWFRDNLF